MIVGIDVETYSSVDIKKAGSRPYTEAPDFTILLISYKVDDQPTKIIDLTASREPEHYGSLLPAVKSDLPAGDLDEFLALLTDPAVLKTAYAEFKRRLRFPHGHQFPPGHDGQAVPGAGDYRLAALPGAQAPA